MAKKRKTLKEMTVKEWNRQYNLNVAKRIAYKVAVVLGYAAVVVLAVLAVTAVVMMITNNFPI